MDTLFNLEFEKAVRLLSEHLPISDETTRKPILFHDVRVGVYLYEQGYSRDIVLAGLLHDLFENSTYDKELLKKEFGENVVRLVLASTKDESVDKSFRNEEMIARCAVAGEDAMIVKVADTLDSFKFYFRVGNQEQLQNHCLQIADLIFKYKLKEFNDKIFAELKEWQDKCSIV